MADAQLEGLVQKMLDGGADDATIKEAVGLYQAKQQAAPMPAKQAGAPGQQWPRQAEAAMHAQDVSNVVNHPLAPWSLAADAATAQVGGAALQGAAGLAPAAGRLLSQPGAVAGVTGAAMGYRHGGIPGAIEGGVAGYTLGGGRLPGAAGRLVSMAAGKAPGAARILTPAAKAASEGLAKLPTNLVLSPEQAAQEAAWQAILRQEASKRGLGYAAGAQ